MGSVASTQELARSRPIGSAVVADHQQAGRGRLGRVWEAPPGTALLASFVLRYQPLAPLAAGVAAAEACGPSVRLKWPNDLLLEGRKLGGILVEAVGDRCVVGVGVNRWTAGGPCRASRCWKPGALALTPSADGSGSTWGPRLSRAWPRMWL